MNQLANTHSKTNQSALATNTVTNQGQCRSTALPHHRLLPPSHATHTTLTYVHTPIEIPVMAPRDNVGPPAAMIAADKI